AGRGQANAGGWPRTAQAQRPRSRPRAEVVSDDRRPGRLGASVRGARGPRAHAAPPRTRMSGEAPVWELAKGEPGFPAQLLDLGGDAPERVFGCGHVELIRDLALDRCVTIVGSRRASSYGLRVAEELGQLLAAAGLVIVSGMARGIDAAAHRGAL